MRALIGNEVTPTIQYKYRAYNFSIDNSNSNDPWYAGAPYLSPYDCAIQLWHTAYDDYAATIDFDSQLTALLASGFTWASSETPVTTGGYAYGNEWYNSAIYIGSGGGNMGVVKLSLAKNITTSTQPYFIARYRSTATAGQSPTWFPTGPYTVTSYVLELISSGYIESGKVIGYGADISLPIPDGEKPMDLTNLGDALLMRDSYFAIIGQSPAEWASSAGLSFGTTTISIP